MKYSQFIVNLFLLLFLGSVFLNSSISAQSPPANYNQIASAIDSLIATENYEAAMPLATGIISTLKNTGVHDSVYHFLYNASRAVWKVKGSDAGVAYAEDVYNHILKTDPDTVHLLQATNDMSWVYSENGLAGKMRDIDKEYLLLCTLYKNHTPHQWFVANYNIAVGYLTMGNGKDALPYLEACTEEIEEKPEEHASELVDAINARATAKFRMGLLDEAKEDFEYSRTFISLLEDSTAIYSAQANYHNNLALIYHDSGDLLIASEMHKRALQYNRHSIRVAPHGYQRDMFKRYLVMGYRNLATIYFTLGDLTRTEQLLKYSLSLTEGLVGKEDPLYYKSYESFGTLYMALEEYDLALEYLRKFLNYSLENYERNSYYVGATYFRIGQLYQEKGEFQQAIDPLTQAVEIFGVISAEGHNKDLANAYEIRGAMYSKLRNFKAAERDLRAALAIHSNSFGSENVIVGRARIRLAQMLEDAGQTDAAREELNRALHILEQARLASDTSAVGRASMAEVSLYLPDAYLAKARQVLLFNESESPEANALAWLDKGLSELRKTKNILALDESQVSIYQNYRSLFELSQDLLYRQYADQPSQELLNRMLGLCDESKGILLKRQLTALNASQFAEVPDSLVRLEQKLAAQLTGRIAPPDSSIDLIALENQYSKLLSLLEENYPQYYNLRFADETTTLEVVRRELLGDSVTLVQYILTDSSLYALVIGPKSEELIRLDPDKLKETIEAHNRAITHNQEQAYVQSGSWLFDRLVRPLIPHLKHPELLIVPDKELYGLNFETLLCDRRNPRDFLINKFLISYLISPTTAVQYKTGRRGKAQGGVGAFAPGFSDDQKRRYAQTLTDSASFDWNYLRLLQQPFAVKTARGINNLAGGKAFVAEEATEANFKRQANEFNILYVGTHTEINNYSPLLSRLVFSKSASPQDSGEDGYLHAYEIYNMSLRAELAMLTACETGTGKGSTSEGALSLAHSFAYAGCPSVVMALWKIDEKSSAEITERFYAYLADGLPRNAALRQAKLDYLANPQNSELTAPYYWAGMVLLGETAPVAVTQSWSGWWWLVGGVLLVIVGALSVWRRTSSKNEDERS